MYICFEIVLFSIYIHHQYIPVIFRRTIKASITLQTSKSKPILEHTSSLKFSLVSEMKDFKQKWNTWPCHNTVNSLFWIDCRRLRLGLYHPQNPKTFRINVQIKLSWGAITMMFYVRVFINLPPISQHKIH